MSKIDFLSIEESIFSFIIFFLIVFIVTLILLNLNKALFKYLERDKKSLHLHFFHKAVHVLIIVIAVLFSLNEFEFMTRFYRMLFSSTVVITAIIGLAAQNILQDAFAGITLSISHPFEIGDRILLEDVSKPCIVEDMTLRHVVLKTMDGIRFVIPNNSLSDKTITNTSYHQRLRGSYITIPIAYSSDIRKAITIIRNVIMQCPYTFPNNPDNEDINGYGEVYLMSFDDNSLNLETTIWTEPSMDNFLATSEIRISILEAFRENNIEIPYNYTNVIIKDNNSFNKKKEYTTATPRNIMVKSDLVKINDYRKDLPDCFYQVNLYCDFHNIIEKDRKVILLLSEELIAFSSQLLKRIPTAFWIEGDQDKIILHLQTRDIFSRSNQLALIKNASTSHLTNSLPGLFTNLKMLLTQNIEPSGWFFESQTVKGHDYEKMLLLNYSDDIKIGMINRHLTCIIVKNLTTDTNPAKQVIPNINISSTTTSGT